jgi:hypothetical protein
VPSLLPLCLRCARFRGIAEDVGYVCEAFGGKSIPPEILSNAADHRYPYPGDGGRRFAPLERDALRGREIDLVALALGRWFGES